MDGGTRKGAHNFSRKVWAAAVRLPQCPVCDNPSRGGSSPQRGMYPATVCVHGDAAGWRGDDGREETSVTGCRRSRGLGDEGATVPAGTLAPGFAVAYHGERAAPALSDLGAAPRTPRHQEAGALGGAFWGFLFGLIFLVPFLGAAIGAGAGALLGSLWDVGISDAFIKDVREKI